MDVPPKLYDNYLPSNLIKYHSALKEGMKRMDTNFIIVNSTKVRLTHAQITTRQRGIFLLSEV